ncbi:hypothetical protein MLD38_022033 [Melastoma candidum]|uniref:Uncharacterized protein n=1 Tax=Melastoma candidum TaxID=119954 RepID=A0ACB9QR29_9MYRT|nr:hypothetical protein MLD38_022033 [Melastoma candidum]
MKRGYESSSSSPSSTFGPPQSRFKYNPEGDSQFLEDESTKFFARKKLNNWIKSVLIQLSARRGDAVMDLACGKAGDLIKWDKAKIGYYVVIGIAEGSIQDCRTRYNGDADHHQRRKKFTFPAHLICGDCCEARSDDVLANDAPFDICSCQFALHYSWSTEAWARRALANVSALLRPGAEGLEFAMVSTGYSSMKNLLKNKFHLEDAVDCPEWIVPFHVFKPLAEGYDLDIVFVKNSHEFVHEYLKKPVYVELMRRLGALGDCDQDQIMLSQEEWEVAYLYLSFVLRKARSFSIKENFRVLVFAVL